MNAKEELKANIEGLKGRILAGKNELESAKEKRTNLVSHLNDSRFILNVFEGALRDLEESHNGDHVVRSRGMIE